MKNFQFSVGPKSLIFKPFLDKASLVPYYKLKDIQQQYNSIKIYVISQSLGQGDDPM